MTDSLILSPQGSDRPPYSTISHGSCQICAKYSKRLARKSLITETMAVWWDRGAFDYGDDGSYLKVNAVCGKAKEKKGQSMEENEKKTK